MDNNTSFYVTETTSLQPAALPQLLRLWNQEYPARLSMPHVAALGAYLAPLGNPRHLLLHDGEGHIHGWAWAFDRDGQRWFAVILATALHGQGLGRQLMQQLQRKEHTLNGWVTDHNNDTRHDGTPYPSPLGFYLRCGFTVLHGQRLGNDKISAVKVTWTVGNPRA